MKKILVWIIMLHIFGALQAQNKIKKYEYWVDDNLTDKVVTSITPAQNLHLIATFPVSQVSEGFHLLHIRFADTANVWSSVVSQYFLKYPQNVSVAKQIVAYEYWVDNGYGSRVSQSVTPSQYYHLNTTLDLSAYSAGFHLLNIRFKDNKGEWSGVLTQYFMKYPENVIVPKQIVTYEYWVDGGYGNKIVQNVTPSQYFHLNTNIDLSSTPVGFHLLHFRFKDSMGEWSAVLTQYFVKDQVASAINNRIIAYRYWFDNDFSSATMINLSNPVKYFHLIDSVATPALSTGSHIINYHFKDSLKTFSSVVSDSFEIITCLPHPGNPITGPTSICPGQTGMNYYSAPIGNATSYLWTLPQGFSIIAGGNTNSITVSCTSGALSGAIKVRGTNSCGTGPDSPPLNVSVNPLPAPTITGQTVVCVNTPGIVYSTEVGMSFYNWSVSSGGIITSGAGTPAITVTWTSLGSQTISVSYLHSNGCGTGTATKSVTVQPLPTVNPIANQNYCNSEIAPSVSVTGPVAGTTFTWTNSNPSIGLSPLGSGDIPSFTAINTGTTPAVALIIITPEANGCNGPDLTFTIVVNPTPIVNTVTDQNYYNGDVAPVTNLSGPVSGTGFSWVNNNVSIGLPAGGSGNVPGFIATNTGAGAVSAMVTITPIASGCTGPNSSYVITVYPTQVICTLSVTPASQVVPASPEGLVSYTVASNCPWTASSNQAWCTVTPTGNGNGTIVANYTVNTLPVERTATITVTVSGTTPVQVAIMQKAAGPCEPSWRPVQNQQYSMHLIASLYLSSVLSINPYDAVGAFVGQECRGIAHPVPSMNGLVFLTITSNLQSGEAVTFKAWKFASCEECPIAETVTFIDPSEIGTLTDPFELHCGLIELCIDFGTGYTWFSVNVNPGSMALNPLFSGLNVCENDRIIGQQAFAVYYSGHWVGSLKAINPAAMYKLKLCTQQKWCVVGQPVPVLPITIGSGYPWIGYLPQVDLPINTALGGIIPAPVMNDRMEAQTTFSVYTGSQWVGSLTTLKKGKGYIISLSNSSVLNYPTGFDQSVPDPADENNTRFTLSPTGDYPGLNPKYTMQIIAAIVLPDGIRATDSNDIVYVYSGDECMGMASPVPGLDGHIFLSVGSDIENGDQLSFRVYLSKEKSLYEVNNRMEFSSLSESGTMETPYELKIDGANIIPIIQLDSDGLQIGEMYPNPSDDLSSLDFTIGRPGHFSAVVVNSIGINTGIVLNDEMKPGKYTLTIDTKDLIPGMYMLRIIYTDDRVQRYFIKKMVVR